MKESVLVSLAHVYSRLMKEVYHYYALKGILDLSCGTPEECCGRPTMNIPFVSMFLRKSGKLSRTTILFDLINLKEKVWLFVTGSEEAIY